MNTENDTTDDGNILNAEQFSTQNASLNGIETSTVSFGDQNSSIDGTIPETEELPARNDTADGTIPEAEGGSPSLPFSVTAAADLDPSANSERTETKAVSVITQVPLGSLESESGALVPDIDGPMHRDLTEQELEAISEHLLSDDLPETPEEEREQILANIPDYNPVVDWYVDHRAVKFNRQVQKLFLLALAKYGTVSKAARKVGMSLSTIRLHQQSNTQFNEAVEEARQYFRDRIEDEIQRRAIDGWLEPVFGGKFKDEVVGYVRKFDSKLLELLAKRHIPEYKEKSQIDHNHTGGVLLIPTAAPTAEEWAANAMKIEQKSTEDIINQ